MLSLSYCSKRFTMNLPRIRHQNRCGNGLKPHRITCEKRKNMGKVETYTKNSYPEALEHLKKALGIKTADVAEKDIDGQMTLTDYPGVTPEGVLNDEKA